jgi:glyoxylase-like metal-dependent hydrolase (beta-lactamase superfamily II)
MSFGLRRFPGLRTPDETLAVTGDLLLHAAQLGDPAITYLLDDDPDEARTSRIALLDELRDGNAVLATSHPTEPFHPV